MRKYRFSLRMAHAGWIIVLFCLQGSAMTRGFGQISATDFSQSDSTSSGYAQGVFSGTGATTAYSRAMGGNRASLAGWRSFRSARSPMGSSGQTGRYNMKIGEVEVRLETGLEVEYNSNLDLTATDPVSDLIFRPMIGLGFNWAFSPYNTLSLTVGVEYEKYLQQTDNDRNGLLLSPNTELVFNVFTGDFKFTLYERPYISQEPSDDGTLTNVGAFQQFTNNAGLIVTWDLNKLILSSGFDWQNVTSTNGNFGGLNSTTYTLFGSAFYLLSPNSQIGVTGSIASLTYPDDKLNNSVNTQVSLVYSADLTRYTSVSLSAGVQNFTFDENGTPITEAQAIANSQGPSRTNIEGTLGGGNYFGPVWSVSITNQLNDRLDQTLSFGQEAQSSAASNYVFNTIIAYQIFWTVNRITDIRTGVYYDRGYESGTDPNTYNLYGAVVSVQYHIFQSWKVYTDYYFLQRVSDVSSQSYTQNRFLIGAKYEF